MKVARRHRASRRGKGRGHISRMNADAAQIAKRAMEGDALLKNFRSALHIALPHEEVAKVAEGKGQPVLRVGGAQLGHSRYPPLDRRIEVTSKPRDQLACEEQLAVCGARSAFLGQGDPFINPGLSPCCMPAMRAAQKRAGRQDDGLPPKPSARSSQSRPSWRRALPMK